MSHPVPMAQAVIGVEEHAWTPELRDALLRYGGDDTVTMMSSQPDIDRRLLDVGDERLARMDAAGVDLGVLSVTTPGTQPLPPGEAVPLARDANDFLADAVRRRPDRFAAFATLPTPVPEAAAEELERCVTRLGLVGALLFPRTGEAYLDHDHRMLTQAIGVLGTDHVMFGQDDPYGRSAGRTGADSRGRFAGNGGVRVFVDTAPISPQDKAKLAHLNAERLLARQAGQRTPHQPLSS
jgi:Amidohydrolase